jgi:pimeloyl-ACP methyl ester carboxylesterase/DNA-binding CsgD family transcriptional regulator
VLIRVGEGRQYRVAVLRPEVSYARADDGVAIAWSAIGDGPVPIVIAAPLIGQLEIAWEEPAFEHFMSRLAAGSRIVLFDRRGSGLSDHASASAGQLDLPRLASDVQAVLDAAGMPRAVVIGISLGGATALQFAAEHADRTLALLVVAGSARLTATDDYELGIDPDQVDGWIESAAAGWGAGASVEADGPTMAGDQRYRAWAARIERHTISPGGFADTLRASFGYDLRALLPGITAPTLVIHRRDDRGVSSANGRYLADHIPRATYVELPGAEHTYFLGDQGAMLTAIRHFIDAHVGHGELAAAVRRAERKNALGHGLHALTPGEREVTALTAQGLTNAEIADRLTISPFTVDGRLRRVFSKLGISTRVELTSEYTRLDQPL